MRAPTIEMLPPYHLVEQLRGGGMADVYLARPTRRSRFSRLVIKTIRGDFAADPCYARMFEREILATTSVRSPHVVRAIDWSFDPAEPFLALEYIEGTTLHRVLKEGPLEPSRALRIALEIGRALIDVHRAADRDGFPLGLVHCDVSPSNILITPSGCVKLIDFGAVQLCPQPRRLSVVAGKRGYSAPELRAGCVVDQRADLYSLGVLLTELLPLRGGPLAIIDRLTAREPSRRYPTARDAVAALARHQIARSTAPNRRGRARTPW